MTRSSVSHVYRIEIDSKHGWLASTFGADQFDRVLKGQLTVARRNIVRSKQLTELQQALLKFADDDCRGIHYQMIGVTDRDGYAERARLILDDLQRFTPDQVFGQNVPSLYFIAEADGRPSLGDLQGLMKKYPQFGMGWPESAAEYRQQMTTAGEKRYTKRRARCLKYWFDQAGGDLDWLYHLPSRTIPRLFSGCGTTDPGSPSGTMTSHPTPRG